MAVDKTVDFIVDTGAGVSVIPPSCINSLCVEPSAVRLSSATGQSLKVHGEITMDIVIVHLRRKFSWTFIVADVVAPLLGQDFLAHYGLIVDCKRRELRDSLTNCCAVLLDSDTMPCGLVVQYPVDCPASVRQLLRDHPSLTSPRQPNEAVSEMKHMCQHTIDTGSAAPTFSSPRRLTPEREKAAKHAFKSLIEQGVVKPSNSSWASPLHLVAKSTPGEWRVTGDYRALNAKTVPDRYPLPHIHDLSFKLTGMNVFTKLDLLKAYYHIPMAPGDAKKTAVMTPFGLFEYNFMPMGLKNAAATFQRFMDTIFRSLSCVFIYMDDLLIFSQNETEHVQHIEMVFQILAAHGLRLAVDKCVFVSREVTFLGHHVSPQGISPPKHRVEAISEMELPADPVALRRYLGMLGFYRRMMPRFADVVFPLSELMRLQSKSKTLEWTVDAKAAFDASKQLLVDSCTLPYPSPHSDTFVLVTDASSQAIGAGLHQMVNGKSQPVSFFSKKLSVAQRAYSTYDRELLAAYLAVVHFRHFIEGRQVTLMTDHKPLVTAFRSQKPAKLDRQQRHWAFISEHVNDVQFISGSENVVADCLSRSVNSVQIDAYDLPAIAEAQSQDPDTLQRSSLRVYPVSGQHKLFCDISTGYPRPYLPEKCRFGVFQMLHGPSHPGRQSSVKLVKSRYFWPKMTKDIHQWVKECSSCQQAKVHRHTKSPVSVFSSPSAARFETLHMDIVGPLPSQLPPGQPFAHPYRYLLTCIDRTTRWMEAVPLTEVTAKSVARALVNNWICRFGVPVYVITDRGPQFEADLFNELAGVVGFHRLRTTAYHPQGNGLVERAHRVLKTAITARAQDWLTALPIVLLGMRMIPASNGVSPFTAVTGGHLLCPKVAVDPDSSSKLQHDFVKELSERMTELDFGVNSEGVHHGSVKEYIPKDLENCSHVWLRVDRVRRPLEAPYKGPFRVLRRTPKVFTLELISGKSECVSVDRLKPAYVGEQSATLYGDRRSVTPPVDIDTPDESPCQSESPSPSAADETDVASNATASVSKTRSGRTVRFRQRPDYIYY